MLQTISGKLDSCTKLVRELTALHKSRAEERNITIDEYEKSFCSQ